MTKRLAFLTRASLVSLLLISGNAEADDPHLTMHVMLGWGVEPLDWDDKKSLALVTMPNDEAEELMEREIAVPNPEVVEQTLAANFPDLSEEEVNYLADLFLEAFQSRGGEVLRANFVAAPLIHVRADGSEFLDGDANPIFWNEPPAEGATAKTGPEGHMLLLGEFHVVQQPGEVRTYTLTAESEAAIPIGVAIVMFSR